VFDPDIIGITESWTDDKISDTEIHIEGFEVFRQDRLMSKGGGVVLYIKDSLVASAGKTLFEHWNKAHILVDICRTMCCSMNWW